MMEDLMQARIDRQKYAVPEKYGNHYQLGKLVQKNGPSECTENCSNRSALASRLKWVSVGSRIGSLRHWIWTPGGFAHLLGHWMRPKGFHQWNLLL